jgi:hypothetical protein
MPGYGFAEAGRKATVEAWTKLVRDYLRGPGDRSCACLSADTTRATAERRPIASHDGSCMDRSRRVLPGRAHCKADTIKPPRLADKTTNGWRWRRS